MTLNPKRFSLSNVPGRDDDVEDVHLRTERELRRRLREADPTYTQKRLDANRGGGGGAGDQSAKPAAASFNKTELPTPDQAVLERELGSATVGPAARSSLLLRQNAAIVYPVDLYGQTKKPNMARWMDVANDSDVAAAIAASGRGGNNQSPSDARAAAGTPGAEEIAASRGRPTFLPDPHMTQLYARRCVEVASKTAAIRYRDVCNAKTADEMGALGVDPEMMGNFGGADNSAASIFGSPLAGRSAGNMRGSAARQLLPDNYHGVPTRGDSDARLIAYRRLKEKDKMAAAQRQLVTAQARLEHQRELEEGNIAFDPRAESDGEGAPKVAQYAPPPTAQEVFDDCAVYFKDGNAITDPGFPMAMRLGTVDNNSSGGGGLGGNGMGRFDGGFTGSGIDMGSADNEDLLILTTPQLRLASKCVLQCIFSLQAADLRADTVPTIPLLQFVPVRQCPVFVQKTHTLMMHDLKARLRKGEPGASKPVYVCWTRVLLSRSGDPEDDIVAADDVHVGTTAPAGDNSTARQRGPDGTLSPLSGQRSLREQQQQRNHFGGTLQPGMKTTDALLTGAASIDVMISSPMSANRGAAPASGGTPAGRGSTGPMSPNTLDRLVAVSTRELNVERSDGKGQQDPTALLQARRNRPPPAIPVLVRAPRPILVKPTPRVLFEVPAPSANEIANEFKEFSRALRPLLELPPDPPGASRNDPDRTPTESALASNNGGGAGAGSDNDDDPDGGMEEIELDEEHEVEEQVQEQVQRADGSIAMVTKTVVVRRPVKKLVPRARKHSAAGSNASTTDDVKPSSSETSAKKPEGGANAWESSRGAMKALSLEDIYEPMKDPTPQQAEQLLADNAPFDKYETAALTARAIMKKLRQIQASQQRAVAAASSRSRSGASTSSSLLSVIDLGGSDGERLRFRLYEALEFIKQHAVDETSRLARASGAIEFRFKMQESFLAREVETAGFVVAAKGIINADQRIQLLEQRMASGTVLELVAAQRAAMIQASLEQDRVVRRSNSLPRREAQRMSPQGRRGSASNSPAGAYRQNSPMRPGVSNGNSNVDDFNDEGYRRLPEPVVLKYAKREAENAPASVQGLIESTRVGAEERPPVAPTPGGNSPRFERRPPEPEAEEEDDKPALVEMRD